MTDREKLLKLLDDCFEKEYTRSGLISAWHTADYLLANGVRLETKQATSDKTSDWISVEDRLPEEGDRCLCRIKSFAFLGSSYQSILRYDKYGFADGSIYEEDVTHWMPLPEPPGDAG